MIARTRRWSIGRTAALGMFVLVALLLGVPSVAQAGLKISPPGVVDVDAGGEWKIPFAVSCPAGMTCGTEPTPGTSMSPDTVALELRHESLKSDDPDLRFQHGLWYAETAYAPMSDSAVVVGDFDSDASGRWTISTTWMECPLPRYPFETAANPCSREPVEQVVTVRPNIFEPRVALYGVGGEPRLVGANVAFYRTGPLQSYRVKVAIQRQVGKRRWKTIASRTERATRSMASAKERYTQAVGRFAMPSSLAGSAKLRARLTVTTKGAKPAMKPRTFTTEVKSRAELKQDSSQSGGVVIG